MAPIAMAAPAPPAQARAGMTIAQCLTLVPFSVRLAAPDSSAAALFIFDAAGSRDSSVPGPRERLNAYGAGKTNPRKWHFSACGQTSSLPLR
jgi:hypothetical protein